MGISRRSLAEDTVDRYNHTWSVLFLLLLSLITWLLPLSPSLQPQRNIPFQDGGSAAAAADVVISPVEKPRYVASCWCPAHFTDAMIQYANQVCASATKPPMKMKNNTESPFAAQLYRMDAADADFPGSPVHLNAGESEKDTSHQQAGTARKSDANMARKKKALLSGHKDAAWHFMQVTTPCALFLLAVCLKIPHLVWTLLACVTRGLNVHQALLSATEGSRLDHQSRLQLYRDIAKALSRCTRACSWVAGVLYLLFKVLMCVAAVAGLLVVQKSLLPHARATKDIFQTTMFSHNLGNEDQEASGRANDMIRADQLLICDFKVRQMALVHHYMIQCLFRHIQPPSSGMSLSPKEAPSVQTGTSFSSAVGVYETLYLIVLTHLTVLAVVNVFSLFVWVTRLTCKSCQAMASSGQRLPLDARLLLQMASENTGPEVVAVLGQGEMWSTRGEPEKIALHE